MKHRRDFVLALLSVLLFGNLALASAQAAEKRVALVVGNANYSSGTLPTPANDAGLIAQTLQAAGFDVVGVRDLDQDSLRRTFRDFIAKVSAAGPDTVSFIYLSGYGLQLEGENYFVPTDANIARDVNVSSEALRLSDYTKPLAALGIKVSIVVLDGARASPFAKSGPPLASGLALVEPDPGTLIAFNAAPGTVAQNEAGPYSSYAQALAEMMREGGLPATDLFNRVRLRVNEATKGAQVPWNASKLEAPFYFFERAPDAPPPQVSPEQTSSIRSKPIRDFDARDGYLAALDRDNLQDYENFLRAYPNDPMARRVQAIVAARREAITWRRSRSVDTPPAYWSYLRRYPRGSHANDARRRLAYLAAALEPPPRFEIISYDVPPPPPEEVIYVERPVLIFDDPDFGFEPPPPPPVFFLPPRPVYFVDLAPPPPPVYAYILPVPVYVPVPVWVNTPEYVAPPPNNVIYNNIHNTVVVNNTTNTVVITNPSGQTQTFSPPVQAPASQTQPPAASKSSPSSAAIVGAGVAGAGAAALLAPSLPPSVAPKAIPIQNTTPPNTPPPGQTQPTARRWRTTAAASRRQAAGRRSVFAYSFADTAGASRTGAENDSSRNQRWSATARRWRTTAAASRRQAARRGSTAAGSTGYSGARTKDDVARNQKQTAAAKIWRAIVAIGEHQAARCGPTTAVAANTSGRTPHCIAAACCCATDSTATATASRCASDSAATTITITSSCCAPGAAA